jgi:cellobiose dehydrogenase (acceptor)
LLSTALIASAAPIAENCTAEADYDVIIIGSGPAGIIVADRMSEAGKKTLLLEQGGPSYYITGGRERPGWLNGNELSRVDVPGLYKVCSDYQLSSSALLISTVHLFSHW